MGSAVTLRTLLNIGSGFFKRKERLRIRCWLHKCFLSLLSHPSPSEDAGFRPNRTLHATKIHFRIKYADLVKVLFRHGWWDSKKLRAVCASGFVWSCIRIWPRNSPQTLKFYYEHRLMFKNDCSYKTLNDFIYDGRNCVGHVPAVLKRPGWTSSSYYRLLGKAGVSQMECSGNWREEKKDLYMFNSMCPILACQC